LKTADPAQGRRVVLVRHSLPDIRRDVPAAQWGLSEAGRARAEAFARHVDPGSARTVFSSDEPKAVETATALAAAWGLDVQPTRGLHEHDRPEAKMLSRDQFEDRIRQMFARPADLVFGAETAERARRRFTAALMRLVVRSSEDVIVVSHGTVMTLFIAEATGVDPFAFWKKLDMPCAVILELPELRVAGITSQSAQSPRPS
jgi:broad specificity phosphatase PhoE